jgi:hypothetical protein
VRAVFIAGPCDAQERVVNGDQAVRLVKMPSGELVRYDLLLRYGDTLIYSQQLSLLGVMDLLVDRYLGDPS